VTESSDSSVSFETTEKHDEHKVNLDFKDLAQSNVWFHEDEKLPHDYVSTSYIK
jgi:hypothetical protein